MTGGGRRSDDDRLRPDRNMTAERHEVLSEEVGRVVGIRGEVPMEEREAQAPREELRIIRLAAEVTYKPETSSHEVSYELRSSSF